MEGLDQLIHVAGTRMIWSSVDGLFKRRHNAGDDWKSMLSFVPLAKSDERSNDLALGPSWAVMQEEEATRGVISSWCGAHPAGGYDVWLPPGGILANFEWLGQSIHKRPIRRTCAVSHDY
jgi:hypothetical protein